MNKYHLHSPSPSKQHAMSNVQSPRTLSRTPTPGTPHQNLDEVPMASPSMSVNLQRHPSQPARPPPPVSVPNNGTLANMAQTRNVLPSQMQQQQQQQQQIQVSPLPHHVRFNQDLLNNYGINVPMTRQTSQPGTNEAPPPSPSSSTPVTSLIPLPSPLPNNLGVNIHHMNQASITPTILGGFSVHQSPSQQTANPNNFLPPQQTNMSNKTDNHLSLPPPPPHGSHHPLSTSTHHAPQGIYVNTRPIHQTPVPTVTGIAGKVKAQQQQQQQVPPQQGLRPGLSTNGTPTGQSAVLLRYQPMMQTPQQVQQQQQQQQHSYQMMKPRMMPSTAFAPRGAPPSQPPPPHSQLIMQSTPMQQQQQTPIIYDPNNLYRTTGQPPPPHSLVQQQQQQQLTQLQSNSQMNESLMNQQKHPHQQSVLQLPPGMLTTDDNILKSLLKINPPTVS